MAKQSRSRHQDAAKRHERQARAHELAAKDWLQRGDSVSAGLEQRAAKLERELAQLKRDQAAHEARSQSLIPVGAGQP